MIVSEHIGPYSGGGDLIRTYSTSGYKIRQDGTGDVYEEAVDPEIMGRTYTETDELIPRDESSDAFDREIINILLGDEGVDM